MSCSVGRNGGHVLGVPVIQAGALCADLAKLTSDIAKPSGLPYEDLVRHCMHEDGSPFEATTLSQLESGRLIDRGMTSCRNASPYAQGSLSLIAPFLVRRCLSIRFPTRSGPVHHCELELNWNPVNDQVFSLRLRSGKQPVSESRSSLWLWQKRQQ